MCGRYTITKKADLIKRRFNVVFDDSLFKISYNAAPAHNLPVITNAERNKVNFFRWGLIPYWAKDISIGNRLINARAETLKEKPSFMKSLHGKRCLVISDGFYEWKKTPAGKEPYRMALNDDDLYAFAGLWDEWNDAQGKPTFSFTVITTDSNELMKEIHNRMPVILKREDEGKWLAQNTTAGDALDLLKPYPSGLMKAFPVSKQVNSPSNNGPELIKPV